MASVKQLQLVLGIEKDKEDKLQSDFQAAKQHLFEHQQKLTALEQYRLDYLNVIKQKASEGLGATALIQHQSFVGKLDKACEQQVNMINQATLVVDQRKRLYFEQQAKSQAISKLIDKRSQQQSIIEAKQEQKLFDELSGLAHLKQSLSKLT
ncbi:flagellar export protein FliJ [Ningiella sp. W23]|uniref:flagellar export protein FliJ n=1 Tax=Ningiella sp. W23 TaxID=3023715 RepID=UPI003757816C